MHSQCTCSFVFAFFSSPRLYLCRKKNQQQQKQNEKYFTLAVYQIRHFVCLCAYSNEYICGANGCNNKLRRSDSMFRFQCGFCCSR